MKIFLSELAESELLALNEYLLVNWSKKIIRSERSKITCTKGM
jgi:hypothetical protein